MYAKVKINMQERNIKAGK